MKGRIAAIGLSAIVAIVSAGYLAVAASAINVVGTTAFTCQSVKGSGSFKDSHCKEKGSGAEFSFNHVAIAEWETTEAVASNTTTGGERASFALRSTQAGIATEIVAKVVSGSGWVTNLQNVFIPTHYVRGEGTVTFSEVQVSKPAEKGCKVKGGSITSNTLVATTETTKLNPIFEPAKGLVLAEFQVEGCAGNKAIESLNGSYKVEGTVTGVPSGATVAFSEAETTAQETLFLREQKAGIEGSMTFSARANSTEAYTGLAPTKIETPWIG